MKVYSIGSCTWSMNRFRYNPQHTDLASVLLQFSYFVKRLLLKRVLRSALALGSASSTLARISLDLIARRLCYGICDRFSLGMGCVALRVAAPDSVSVVARRRPVVVTPKNTSLLSNVCPRSFLALSLPFC